MSFLVAYASTHGHTGRIAQRVAAMLHEDGIAVDLCDLRAGSSPAPGAYETVVAGGSVHLGRHQPELVRWARRHAASLSLVRTAFFSVSLAAAEDSPAARAAARGYLEEFEDETGWLPDRRVSFAGALQYREYDFPTRLAMRLLMAHGGHPTDIDRDFVYTDWNAVDEFARACARLRSPGTAVTG